MHIIAHRGGKPENTLEGFEKSWSAGVRKFECDVHMTFDGQVVVCHDKVSGGKAIAKSKYNELNGVLKLDDLLKWLRDKKCMYHLAIEIKPCILDLLYLVEKKIFDYCGPLGNVSIISMHRDILKETVLKNKGLIIWKWNMRKDWLGFCDKWGCNSLWINHARYSHKLYEACQNKNIELYVWTLNADGIVTDSLT